MHDDSPRGRPSLRLPHYDYAQPGGYFVTICTHNRHSLFGDVIEGELHHNAAGCMVLETWQELAGRFNHISLDAVVVMPNHPHGIVQIQEETPGQGLGQITGAFKSLATYHYMAGVHGLGWPPFSARLWQDNCFEHVIRSEAALVQIRAYIAVNPLQWESDPERLM
jgi:putative transposase